jgi:2-polyprenyl-3-methyl-5-hydroxy-6-metoxy-1,4-benzoquinol methylase
VFEQGDNVLDVGSGPNGVVSEWFNKTGIVASYALDGSPSMEYVSAGKVAEADARNASSLLELVDELGIEVDWIWCVDVLSSVTEEAASRIVETLFDGINPRKGIILVTDSDLENLSTLVSSSRYSLSVNASLCNRTDIQIFTLAW